MFKERKLAVEGTAMIKRNEESQKGTSKVRRI